MRDTGRVSSVGPASDAVPAAVGALKGTAESGLSSALARQLLAEWGPNTVPEQGPMVLARLVGGLWAPVPWMLEATIMLEALLGKWLDAGVVAAVLALNAALGFVQQGRAQAALALLRQRLSITARVFRDQSWRLVPAAELVPADVVHIRVGDFVPADLRLGEGSVLVDQSTLTGESLPVERARGDTLYSGSTVARGEATGTVTATGARTYFGRTAELVRTSRTSDHLAAVVLRMVRVFIALDVLLAVAGTAYLLLTGASGQDVASYAVVLLLASVPVALPAAFALAGAVGAQHLASQGILTARLPAVQEAGAMDVLCVDKTGTITQNRLVVAETVASGPLGEGAVLRWAATASDEATQDPIDLAILRAAPAVPATQFQRVGFVPFDPATKRSEATLETTTGMVRVTKGAPQVIADLCGASLDSDVARLGESGARVLAVAVRDGEGPWRAAGLVSLADPPRPEAADLVERLTDLGVRLVMVTGDGAATARAIASAVGIPGETVRAGAIRGDALQQDLDELGFGVVAEMLPEDKHHLVRRLQAAGHVVGMTGDGVNDAPALRQADVGMALAGATDVAKSAAGVVLTREGLSDIVGLVEESRRIRQRSLTYALNVSIKKLEVPILLAVGVFAWRQFVFTPLLMALLLLGNDVVSMAITTDRVGYSRRPDRWNVRNIILGALVVAAPLLAVSITVLWVGRDVWPRFDLGHLRTLIFLTLVVSSQAGIYLVRTRSHAWTTPPSRWLLAATTAALAAVTALVVTGTLMSALALGVTGAVFGVVVLGALVADLIKVPAF